MLGSMIMLAQLPASTYVYHDQVRVLRFSGLCRPPLFVLTAPQLLNTMTKVSQIAFAHEPGVRQFALLTPASPNAGDSTSGGNQVTDTALYSLERYTDGSAFRSHINTTVVSEMFAWINSTPDLYKHTPVVHQLSPPQATRRTSDDDADVADDDSRFEFVRPELATAPSPFVLVQQVNYAAVGTVNSGGANDSTSGDAANAAVAAAVTASLPYWATSVSRAVAAGIPLMYSVLVGSGADTGRVFVVSAYASTADYQSYARMVRDGGDAIPSGGSEAGSLFLQLRGGFLFKAPS